MTRETKIGLLVGLAFIIVIGILLSDHFSSAIQTPQAPLMGTRDNVLESTAGIGARRQLPPAIHDIQPNRQIAINPQPDRDPLVQIGPRQGHDPIQVGPGDRGQDLANLARDPHLLNDNNNRGGTPPINRDPPIANGNSGRGGNWLPRDIADQFEPVNPDRRDQPPVNRTEPQVKQYAAVSGDTVYKIAQKFYGGKTKENVDLILKANPALAANPNKIVVGEKYNIPAKTAEENRGGTATPPTPIYANNTTANETAYTTQPGDTLWKIAVEQCNTPNAVNQILELNKDQLRGDARNLKPNMKLKLPPKVTASR